jgi:hypothetical protein
VPGPTAKAKRKAQSEKAASLNAGLIRPSECAFGAPRAQLLRPRPHRHARRSRLASQPEVARAGKLGSRVPGVLLCSPAPPRFLRLAPVAQPFCRNPQDFNETGGICERSERRHQGFDASGRSSFEFPAGAVRITLLSAKARFSHSEVSSSTDAGRVPFRLYNPRAQRSGSHFSPPAACVAAITSVIRVLSPRWAAPFAMADFFPADHLPGVDYRASPNAAVLLAVLEKKAS